MLAARHDDDDDDYLDWGGVKRVIYVFVSTLSFFVFVFCFCGGGVLSLLRLNILH